MTRLYKPLLQQYLQKDRLFRFEGLEMQIKTGVFHPAFFGSSKVFARFLKRQELVGKLVLEIGCGSGLLSLVAAQKGARVWAVDINPESILCAQENAERNALSVQFLESDLFAALPPQNFDVILLNPPFYPGEPQKNADFAWYAGTNFQFFHRFFSDLPNYTTPTSIIWMILSETCDLAAIQKIARAYEYQMTEIHRQTRLAEHFLIFDIQKLDV